MRTTREPEIIVGALRENVERLRNKLPESFTVERMEQLISELDEALIVQRLEASLRLVGAK